jgi:hypothetical protein
MAGSTAPGETGDHAWRWSREGVEQRIATMTPADALLTIEQYNARHPKDRSRQLDPGLCLRGLSPAESEEVGARVAALRRSATDWGQKYWARRLAQARLGLAEPGDDAGIDSDILAEMARQHPDFAGESLLEVYHTGIMLAR